MGEVATKELEELIFVFVLAAEIIKVLDSIAWVRCASGNVLFVKLQYFCSFLLVDKVVNEEVVVDDGSDVVGGDAGDCSV